MRNVVVVLAAVIASGCAADDGGDANASSTEGTTAVGDSGAATDAGLSTGGDVEMTDETGDETDGGLSLTSGVDSSSGTDGETDGMSTSIDEGFEDVLVGEQPGTPWFDVADRIATPTVIAPTASVIDTVDAEGAETRALHLHDAVGTSQGLIARILPSTRHHVAASVRVEQFSDAVGGTTWPVAVGLSQPGSAADINDDPHAAVRVDGDGTWHLLVHNGQDGMVGFDQVLPFPRVEVDRWYRVMLEVDVTQGAFRAQLSDPTTSDVLGEHVLLVPAWFDLVADYDSITLHDGEYGTMGATQGGMASVDDVEYAATYGG